MARHFTRLLLCQNKFYHKAIHINNKILNKNSLQLNTQRMLSTEIQSDDYFTMKQVQVKLADILGIEHGYKVIPPSREHLMQYLPKDIAELEPRSMQDSFTTAYIPLAKDTVLQEKYVSFLGSVRIGRLLEDMDIFAVWVVYQHIKNPRQKPDAPSPHTLVTVLVDKIDFTDVTPVLSEDIKLSGHVSWVGKSSVEVVVWLEQMREGKWHKITRALFLMAARNPIRTGPAMLNPIKPANEREKEILSGGIQRKQKRLIAGQQSLKKVIPNEVEQLVIHNLFQSTMSADDVSLMKLTLPPDSQWMEKCTLSNIIFSHPENRNLHNSVFGGFIMRNAFELSLALAFLFSKHRPTLKHISDIVFHKPIEVSSLIRMTAYVVYTYKNFIQIAIFAESSTRHAGQLSTTNEFHFTFELNDLAMQVIPKSYHEAMMYIDGKRHFEEAISEVNTIQDSNITAKL